MSEGMRDKAGDMRMMAEDGKEEDTVLQAHLEKDMQSSLASVQDTKIESYETLPQVCSSF